MRPNIYLPCVRGGGAGGDGRVVPAQMLLFKFFKTQCTTPKGDALKPCLLRSASEGEGGAACPAAVTDGVPWAQMLLPVLPYR